MGWLLKLLGGGLLEKLIALIGGHLEGRARTRETREVVDAKVRLARTETEGKLELADHELQVLRTRNSGSSWADEYVTILVSLPIIVSTAGVLIQLVDEGLGQSLVFSAERIASVMTGETIDYPALWLIVVSVALGTKPFRRRE